MRPRQLAVSFCILGLILGTNWTGVVAQSATPLTLANNPWPMFRHDLLHTGRSQYLGAQTFHVKWSFDTGLSNGLGIDSSPVIDSNGNVYVQGRSGYLYSLFPNGTLRWKFFTQDWVVGGINGIEPSPAIDSNGAIYVGSSDSNLYAIFSNGILKWKFPTGGPIQSSPTIGNDGTIYIGSNDGNLYAISQNGQLKWKFTTAGPVVSSPAIDSFVDSSGLKATIYVGSGDARLYAISLSGGLKWSFKAAGGILSSPAIGQGGIVYTEGGDGSLNPTYIFYSSPSIAPDGTIYIGTESEGVLLAID